LGAFSPAPTALLVLRKLLARSKRLLIAPCEAVFDATIVLLIGPIVLLGERSALYIATDVLLVARPPLLVRPSVV
jgi:hypothetical protein